ncbi:hypothetical protein SDC9_153798 [bioreactor metagenome]|uniref:Uncharacterized protein n=1 Tax=bioreactor metagenome TaxID=1076179 RepID=A0A645EZ58_9ZZZZ
MGGGAVEPFAVFIGTEDPDFAVFAAERLAAFENRLPVMERVGGDVQRDVVGSGETAVVPLPVCVMEPDVAPGLHESKSEIVPIDVHDQMPSYCTAFPCIKGKYSRVPPQYQDFFPRNRPNDAM